MGETPRSYDLEERTALFGEAVILFCRQIEESVITRPLVNQLVRAATSVGANYCEANNAESKRDFRHKIAICRKESRESMHWLRMIAAAAPTHCEQARRHWKESQELNRIFSAIYRNSKDTPKSE